MKDKFKFRLHEVLAGKFPLYYYEKKGVHFVKEEGKEWIEPIIEPISVEGYYNEIYMHSNSVLREDVSCWPERELKLEKTQR